MRVRAHVRGLPSLIPLYQCEGVGGYQRPARNLTAPGRPAVRTADAGTLQQRAPPIDPD